MKIVMFGHKRIPSREGGVEVVVEELATRMTERGHEVTCINRRGHHVSGKEFDCKGTICGTNVVAGVEFSKWGVKLIEIKRGR